MKEIRLIVMAKKVFVSGDESKLLRKFGVVGLSQCQFHDSRNTKKNKF